MDMELSTDVEKLSEASFLHSTSETSETQDIDTDDLLELNQFDGLPFSSRYYKLLRERKALPVWGAKCEFMASLMSSQIVIVTGTAKTGQSTQIPQWCAEFCLSAQYQNGMVVCTQIHQQSTVELALRVADEMDVNIGNEVGYSIPLQTCCSPDTVLRYCTDDVLLREMMSDPLLEQCGVVVIDQAQERTVSTDLLLGLLKDVLLARPELRLVILSAPHSAEKLLRHYGSTPQIRLDGPQPCEVVYGSGRGGVKDYLCSALRLALEIHQNQKHGDIVTFLATEQEIECAHAILRREGANLAVSHGELVPVSLCPEQGDSPSVISEESKSRRVFLTCSPSEDLFWAVHSIRFVIDAVSVTEEPVSSSGIHRDESHLFGPSNSKASDLRVSVRRRVQADWKSEGQDSAEDLAEEVSRILAECDNIDISLNRTSYKMPMFGSKSLGLYYYAKGQDCNNVYSFSTRDNNEMNTVNIPTSIHKKVRPQQDNTESTATAPGSGISGSSVALPIMYDASEEDLMNTIEREFG